MTLKDLTPYRADFPMLEQVVHDHPYLYFDTAATALTPRPVIDAITRFYSSEYATVGRAVYSFVQQATERVHQVREQVARFLNGSAEEIVFTRGTTESINLVASALGKQRLSIGDQVVITEVEHHSNIVPWQLICEQTGAQLREIPVNDQGELILEDAEALITPKTKIVALTHVSNALGTIFPIREIITMARKSGALVLVDGAQAAARLPIDVRALDVDFYAFSAHKTYGPTGIGVLYGRREILEDLPPYQGGGDMIEQVTFEETTYRPVPHRFEAGTPHIAGILGLGAALTYLDDITLKAIEEWEQDLLKYATSQLSELDGLYILGQSPSKAGIINFTIEGCHPLDIGTLLDLQGIALRTGHQCAQPALSRFGVEHSARISFGLYNTREEVDRFITALNETVNQLRAKRTSQSSL